MKTLFTIMLLLFCFFCNAQTATNDSLWRYCNRLENNQKIIYKNIKSAGVDLHEGPIYILSGMGATILGGVIVAIGEISASKQATNNYGNYTPPNFTFLDALGVGVGTGGLAISIYGIARIGKAGRKLRKL